MKDWQEIKLGEIAHKFVGGGTPSTKNQSYWQGNIPWITSKWLNNKIYLKSGEKYISQKALENSSTHLVPCNNLLFSTRVGVGKVAINNIDIAINQDLTGVLVDNSQYSLEFLAFQARTSRIQNYFESNKRGATIKGITREDLKDTIFYIPPLPEQRKIAHILSTVQRAIEQQERLIALTTELKKTLMHKLFTEGLRGEPQKNTEIGPVPESWEIVPLESTGEVIYGIQASVANNIKPIGTKILTNKNITLEGELDLEQINYFELTTKRHKATILKKGDILFNWRSGSKEHVGKTAYFDLDEEYTHSSFILRIRPNERVNGRFLHYYLSWLRESGYFVKLQTYSINAKFNKSAINALATILPNRDEQDQIAEILGVIIQRILYHKNRKTLLEELFRTLLHQLMNAQIRVHELEFEER